MRFSKKEGVPRRAIAIGAKAAAIVMLCVAFWTGPAHRAEAQGGTIVIDGNALGRIIAGGMRWEERRERWRERRRSREWEREQRDYGPRTSSRSKRNTRAASTGMSAKTVKTSRKRAKEKKANTEVARGRRQPSDAKPRSDADAVAETSPPEQQPTENTQSSLPGPNAPAPTGSLPSAPTAEPPQSAPYTTAPAVTSAPHISGRTTGPVDAQVAVADPKAISTAAEITAAQEHLKFMGYDIPQANGSLDLKTRIAIIQFQDSIGAQPTGNLTYEQLQTLFQNAASRGNSKLPSQ